MQSKLENWLVTSRLKEWYCGKFHEFSFCPMDARMGAKTLEMPIDADKTLKILFKQMTRKYET